MLEEGRWAPIPPAGAIPLILFMQAGHAVAVVLAIATLARRTRRSP